VQVEADNVYTVIRQYSFDKKLTKPQVRRFVSGQGFVAPCRQNQWGLKKALHALWCRVPGHHFNNVVLHDRRTDCQQGQVGGARKQWKPTKEELEAGRNFINRNVPLDNSENEQLFWIVEQTRACDDSPIYGWPEGLVTKAAENRMKAGQCADSEKFFPLLFSDLHNQLTSNIVPLLIVFALTHGLMMIGMPSIGKTPLAMMMALAMGRYHVKANDLGRKASFRRGKQMDNFRNKPGEVQDGILLDDVAIH
jgi:hypothetical protein